MLHKTLTGWNDPTGQRHEPGEIADYSWLPDLSDLLAASVVRVWFEDVAAPPLAMIDPGPGQESRAEEEQEDMEQAGTFPTARKGRNK